MWRGVDVAAHSSQIIWYLDYLLIRLEIVEDDDWFGLDTYTYTGSIGKVVWNIISKGDK
jgi:hypothetical protein